MPVWPSLQAFNDARGKAADAVDKAHVKGAYVADRAAEKTDRFTDGGALAAGCWALAAGCCSSVSDGAQVLSQVPDEPSCMHAVLECTCITALSPSFRHKHA